MKEFLQQWLPSLTVIVSVWLGYRLTGRAMIQAARQSDERARKDLLVGLNDQWLMRLRLTVDELLANVREVRRLHTVMEATRPRAAGLAELPAAWRSLADDIAAREFRIQLLKIETAFLLRPGHATHDAIWSALRELNPRESGTQLIPQVEEMEDRVRELFKSEWDQIQDMAK
jgi:hypothetical protein